VLAAIAIAAAGGCSAEPPVSGSPKPTADSRRVLVVYNGRSALGRQLAQYYASRRAIPTANIVRIECPDNEDISLSDFHQQIEEPIRANLRSNPNAVDFIVTTKGVPIRILGRGYAVDAWIAAGDLPIEPIEQVTEPALRQAANPYFGSHEPFTSRKFGFHLVTRIDGYTYEDCVKLIDRAMLAQPEKGPFFFDKAANRNGADYGITQQGLDDAAKILRKKGLEAQLEQSKSYVAPDTPLAGYASWGSNDAEFDVRSYRKIRFKPGALCETFVSTSGRTFRPTTGGQSLIADLISNGVTGVKGYVSEPFTFALAKPEILFDCYTEGRNLAESFYAASQFLKWKDVVIGDPLCAPYKK
jgi:uncharacterized protein (TIGR03790 family)